MIKSTKFRKNTRVISIIIPFYNSIETIERAIVSVLNQSFSDYEILVMDDGSEYKNAAFCDELAGRDERIHVHHLEHVGVEAARKAGIEVACGEYISFLDADDYFASGALSTMNKAACEHGADIVVCGKIIEYDDGARREISEKISQGFWTREQINSNLLPQYFSTGGMKSNPISHALFAKLFKTQILVEALKLVGDEKLMVGEDARLTFTSVMLAKSIFAIPDFYAYIYVRSSYSTVGKYDPDFYNKNKEMYAALVNAANRNGYPYVDQVQAMFLDHALTSIKNEISRNPNGFRDTVRMVDRIVNDGEFIKASKNGQMKTYDAKSKIFAFMCVHRLYPVLVAGVKIANFLHISKQK